MRLKSIVYATLAVSDQDAARDFYTNLVGLEQRADAPTRDGARFLLVGVTGQDFGLILWPGRPAEVEQGTGVCTFEVEDCQKAFDTLSSRGVTFTPPQVIEYPWGWVARFTDPDGNLLQIRQGR